jgi:hypothetical protein
VYECPDRRAITAVIPPEAGLKRLAELSCKGEAVSRGEVAGSDDGGSIRIVSATYGGNCGAIKGNVTSRVAAACDGSGSCEYVVDYLLIGDPAPDCGKDFNVVYECRDGQPLVAVLPPEAGFKSVAQLRCD